MSDLFEELGGETIVNFTVELFFEKLLEDAYIRYFFNKNDLRTNLERQKSLLRKIYDGPHKSDSRDMRQTHAHLVKVFNLNDIHFDHILCHLRATLAEVGIEPELIEKVVAHANTHRDDVLNR